MGHRQRHQVLRLELPQPAAQAVRFAELHDRGKLSDAEFEQAKAKLLG